MKVAVPLLCGQGIVSVPIALVLVLCGFTLPSYCSWEVLPCDCGWDHCSLEHPQGTAHLSASIAHHYMHCSFRFYAMLQFVSGSCLHCGHFQHRRQGSSNLRFKNKGLLYLLVCPICSRCRTACWISVCQRLRKAPIRMRPVTPTVNATCRGISWRCWRQDCVRQSEMEVVLSMIW